MAGVFAFIGEDSIGIVERFRAIDQVEMHHQTLALSVAARVLQGEPAHIETLQERVAMLRLAFGDALRDRGKYAIVQIRANRRRLISLDAALHQKKSHLRPLQESFHFKDRIERSNRVDRGRQSAGCRAAGRGAECRAQHRQGSRNTSRCATRRRAAAAGPLQEIGDDEHDHHQHDDPAEGTAATGGESAAVVAAGRLHRTDVIAAAGPSQRRARAA